MYIPILHKATTFCFVRFNGLIIMCLIVAPYIHKKPYNARLCTCISVAFIVSVTCALLFVVELSLLFLLNIPCRHNKKNRVTFRNVTPFNKINFKNQNYSPKTPP